jgi:hypothetical protein
MKLNGDASEMRPYMGRQPQMACLGLDDYDFDQPPLTDSHTHSSLSFQHPTANTECPTSSGSKSEWAAFQSNHSHSSLTWMLGVPCWLLDVLASPGLYLYLGFAEDSARSPSSTQIAIPTRRGLFLGYVPLRPHPR